MIDFQRKLLGDPVRNDALFHALKTVVRPGMTVTDIGSGTGFLSFLALQLEAKHCYLYETSRDLLRLSQRIARENGLSRRCTFIHAHSKDIHSPMKTDIVISETLGNFAYEEHIIENMADAKRFVKSGGIMLPHSLRTFIAPIVTDRMWREVNVWDGVTLSLSKGIPHLHFRSAKEVALNNMYVKTVRSEEILEKAVRQWDSIDFTKKNTSCRKGTVTWNMERSTTLYGFAVWWECDLAPGITLQTSPIKKPTHWEQIYLPLLSPVETHTGDTLSCTITSDSRHSIGLNVTWHTTLHRKKRKIAEQKQELKKGMIFP